MENQPFPLARPAALQGAVLVVEDDELFRRACRAMLSRSGLEVDAVGGAEEGLALCRRRRYDSIVSDIRMPGADGLAFLHDVRQLDATVPFILMTGSPTLESAIDAVNQGATRYLQKPFGVDELVGAVGEAIRVRVGSEDLASLHRRFERGLERLWMAYQPIVGWAARAAVAYEALLRCDAREVPGPGELIALAEKTGRLEELGRTVRSRVARDAAQAPAGAQLFVNLHPEDLSDADLYDARSPLAEISHRVVLELTERTSVAERPDLEERLGVLRGLGYRVAVDDLGAGYAGLTTVARVKPEYVKLDASLVRGIQHSPVRRRVVASMLELARDLDAAVVAEAIETVAERRALSELGVDLMQGYHFARPARPFTQVDAAALTDDVAGAA